LSVIGFFIIGAVVGAVLSVCMSYHAIFVPCLFLFAVFMLMFIREQKSDKEN
jgi:uncharacterized membrane protein YoaK (UPF0700 family)